MGLILNDIRTIVFRTYTILTNTLCFFHIYLFLFINLVDVLLNEIIDNLIDVWGDIAIGAKLLESLVGQDNDSHRIYRLIKESIEHCSLLCSF